MPREKSAGAIIYKEENNKRYYLLLHYPGMNRKGGHWEFAKGHIEGGEDYDATVRREVFEETGLKDIKIIPGFKQHIKYFFRKKEECVSEKNIKNKKPQWIFKLVTFFIAKANDDQVKISSEHIGYLWLPLDQAIKKTTYKNSKELLKKVDKFLTKKSSQ